MQCTRYLRLDAVHTLPAPRCSAHVTCAAMQCSRYLRRDAVHTLPAPQCSAHATSASMQCTRYLRLDAVYTLPAPRCNAYATCTSMQYTRYLCLDAVLDVNVRDVMLCVSRDLALAVNCDDAVVDSLAPIRGGRVHDGVAEQQLFLQLLEQRDVIAGHQ